MSEKKDLWLALVLLLAGAGLAAANALGDRVPGAVAAGLLGVLGALATLVVRVRRGQARSVRFGLGVLVLLGATVPGLPSTPAGLLPWVVAALALLMPVPTLSARARGLLLAGGGAFALLTALALAGVLPRALWGLLAAGAFHLALQALNARPRREAAPPPGPRVALLGGSFDPFHRGHRALAEAALKIVDRLLVVPAGQAPHKADRPETTAFHHRVAMARLGVEGLARVEVLELEGRRAGPSYTVDTLEVVRHTWPAGTRFLLLLGADMYQDLPTWRAWEAIVSAVTLLVAARPGFDLQPPPELEGRNVVVERLEAPLVDVSSTRLRAVLAKGEGVGDLVSPAVIAYVREHGLYRAAPASS